MREKKSIDIERAIETVRLFSQPMEMHELPTLDHFDLQEGRLKTQSRNALEKTVAFTKDCLVRAFSTVLRKKQEQKHSQIVGTLQESLDTLKVYSAAISSLEKGPLIDRSLARRIVMAARGYNALVQKAKIEPHTISGKIKRFFFNMAGWNMDENLIQTEIHLPQSLAFSNEDELSKETWLAHKVTTQRDSEKAHLVFQSVQRTSEKDLSQPKPDELDLFRTKARTLLQNQEWLSLDLEESLELTRSPIDYNLHTTAYLLQTSVMELSQLITIIPGVEFVIKGAFQRDTHHPELALPIKESFEIAFYSFPTGFPHPLQYTGIALHEKLLPTYLLRPHRCPRLQSLLETRYHLSQTLLPNGMHFEKAKQLLRKRRELFKKNDLLFSLQKEAIEAHLQAAGLDEREFLQNFFMAIQSQPLCNSWYEALSSTSFRFNEQVIAQPLAMLQAEWLLKNRTGARSLTFEQAREFLEGCIERTTTSLVDPISPSIVRAVGRAAMNIHSMQLSEHFGFDAPELSSYERKLLVSATRQQLIFAYELQELALDGLEEHLIQTLKGDIALFSDAPHREKQHETAEQIAQELIDYYSVASK